MQELSADGGNGTLIDLLAAEVDMATATIAASWSEREINRMAQAVEQLQQQEARAAA